MLETLLMRHAVAVLTAVLGGFGVFCVIYSFTSPEVAVQALILLGAALAISHFGDRA